MGIFVLVGVIGFVILVGSLVIGEFADFEHDLDIGTDLDGPSAFSLKVIAAGFVGFGAFGVITSSIGLPVVLCWVAGGVGFFAVALSSYYFVVRPLAKQQSNSLISRESYVSQTATVSLAIQPGMPGQVRFTDASGALVEEVARSDEPFAIEAGQSVVIFEVQENHVVVTPINI